MEQADIGIFGGSGFYSFLEGSREVRIETPYGPPSDNISLTEIGGTRVAFLPRHDRHHRIPPHMIPYRANVYAMHALGVKRLFGPCAAGSLQSAVRPGEFVVCDQFVDRTSGRKDTFYDGPLTTHISAADPYCPEMRRLVVANAREMGIPVHDEGTMVVVQGPRFSTRAESRWFTRMGWSVINMTGHPEAILSRELQICYCNISLITDYDVGLEGMEPVSHDGVLKVFRDNNEKLLRLLVTCIESMPAHQSCPCPSALSTAR